MKLIFEEASIELIKIFSADIITTSPTEETDNIGDNDGEPDMEG